MICHNKLSSHGFSGTRKLSMLVQQHAIALAGNQQKKIYGSLKCASGKRMKMANRVFFRNENEANIAGYLPCGHCMREQYLRWKKVRV
jgi:methylphosphotriester-DNA--protein-cysteine methyltransferase